MSYSYLEPSIYICSVISYIFSGVLYKNYFILGTDRIICCSQLYWITASFRISYAVSSIILLFFFPPVTPIYSFYVSIVISGFRSNREIPRYSSQFEWKVYGGYGAVSKYFISSVLFCVITTFCSAA